MAIYIYNIEHYEILKNYKLSVAAACYDLWATQMKLIGIKMNCDFKCYVQNDKN